ncbi:MULTISPECIES: pilus assembly protein TadG-related protein [unclassified Bradyrhizobium]
MNAFLSSIPSLSRLSSLAKRFGNSRDGNIAAIFALSLLPVLGFVGVAVDYSRASAARSAMQGALDSTALMVAKDLSSNVISVTDVPTKAQSYFSGLYTYQGVQNIKLAATYTVGSSGKGSTILVNGSGAVKSDFMQLIGFPSVNFAASSTSTWGTSLLRVSLVLDNTGSMNDYNKIGNLKTAAKNLVTQLSGLAKKDGDVYISVVPFEVDVNVGKANSGANWLRWDLWDPSNTNSRGQSYCSQGYWYTYAQCVGHGYLWGHNPGSPSTSQWNGCVTDRDQNYDISSAAPTSNATNFIADQDQSCPVAPILPLTYNWTAVNNTITAMTAQGATNQTIGLQWGWLSLLQQSPMNAPSEDPNNQYQHVIVLFTDGLNTQNRWTGNGSNGSGAGVDTRMKKMCDAIKQTNVTIYTVQIDTDGAGQSPVLPYCASNPGNFYMLTQPSQIATAFAQIGTSISKLRVAQ